MSPTTLIEETFALTPLQQGMLLHSLLEPDAGFYVQQIVGELDEPIDAALFARAWQHAADRYPMLRAAFRWEGLDEPFQEVARHAEVPFALHDWRDTPPAARQARLERFLWEDRRRGFQMSKAPLMRVALIRLAEEKSQCVWTFHHALLDGRAFPIVLRFVFDTYAALAEGREPAAGVASSFSQYVEWLDTLDPRASEWFWRDLLRGFAAPTPLVVDAGQALGADEPANGAQQIRLSAERTAQLDAFARAHGVTLNILVQGAWALLLGRYSGAPEVVFGVTRSVRRSALGGEADDEMLGLLINTLPVRLPTAPETPLIDMLLAARAQWTGARPHEHAALAQIQEWSDVPRGTPLFDTIVVFERQLMSTSLRALGGGWLRRSFEIRRRMNYPLTLVAYGEPELLLGIEYDRRRFDDATIGRMLGHVATLLEAMPGGPQQRAGEMPLLTPPERRAILAGWSRGGPAPDAAWLRGRCLHELFEAQAARAPEATALVFERERVSYAELNRRANQIAHRLRALGAGPETLVGISAARTPAMVAGMLGILKAGGAYVPLDPNYPAARLRLILEDARIAILVTERSIEQRWGADDQGAPGALVYLDDGQGGAPESNPKPSAGPGNLAYVLFTSGSTGRPKGVAIEHRSAVALAGWAAHIYEPGELAGVLGSTSINFDLSVFELFVTLGLGGTVILAENALHLPTLPAAGEVRLVNTVPSAMAELLRAGGLPTSVRTVNLAGEPLPTELVDRIYALGHVRRVVDLYGPSEDTTYSTFAIRRAGEAATIGRPIDGTQAYVLDASMRPVPAGVPGELYLGGAGLARGYFNSPELTAERFVPNPFDDGQWATGDGESSAAASSTRLYRTGDLCRWRADGTLEYLGRLDQQVKIRGFRIELGEIEAALRAHPGVREAVALVREDEPGDRRLVAYIVPADAQPQDAGSESEGDAARRSALATRLRSHLRARLPEYMVPPAFVELDALPLTPSGKIDRRALPRPEPMTHAPGDGYEAPRTPAEQALAAIWADVLGVARVGINDNFFDMGGHSLQSVQLATRATAALGLPITVKDIFARPSIAALADSLGALAGSGVPAAQSGESETHVAAIRSATDAAPRQGLPRLTIERRPLLSLIAAGKLPPVEAAALSYLPLPFLEHADVSPDEVTSSWFDGLPFIRDIISTSYGRFAIIVLPRFGADLYSDPAALVQEIGEGLHLARTVGARVVSLTGLIPSATDYGRSILPMLAEHPELPPISTGHATTTASVVLSIRRILEEAGRAAAGERVGFLGLGSIGAASLRLMLRCLPHPAEIALCDIYSKRDALEAIRGEVVERLGFSGEVRVLESRGAVPDAFYSSSLIVGATNVPDILDIGRVRPGTLIVDDSAPHCFAFERAVERLERQGDVLFTEGGVLQSPRPISRLRYLPRLAERTMTEEQREAFSTHDPFAIMGCGFSSLLTARFDWLAPTVGLIDVETSLQHYETLCQMGFQAADLHCKLFVLPKEAIRRFRERYGADA